MLYVDDILVISSRDIGIDKVVTQLKAHLDVKDLGRLHHFLGVSFKRNSTSAWLAQRQYTESILRRFKMLNCKPVTAPMCVSVPEDESSESVDQTLYGETIGYLLYLSTRTKPYISTAVSILSCHTSNPKKCISSESNAFTILKRYHKLWTEN